MSYISGGGSSGGSGTVTSVSVVTVNGISGTVGTATTTPAISLTLGAITPTSIVGPTIDNAIIGGVTPAAGSFTTVTGSGAVKTTSAGAANAPSLAVGNSTTGLYSISTTGAGLSVNGTSEADWGISVAGVWSFNGGIITSGAGSISWSGRARLSSPISGSIELLTSGSGNAVFLSNPATATWQLGQLDAASPVAQTLQVQSVVAGNTNVAGATWTLRGSLSNGSGGGDVVFQTTLSSAASGTQNTAVTALTLKGGTQEAIFAAPVRLQGYTVATLPAGNTGDTAYVTDALSPSFLIAVVGGGAVVTPVFYNGSAWVGG